MEEEIERYEKEIHGYDSVSSADCKNIARHFAEWGAKHFRDSTKMIPVEGLEEEIDLWISENENIHHEDKLMVSLLKDVARYFYELGKARKQQNVSAVEVLARAGLKPYKDGNKWCILAGENIQDGICGFGDTVEEALYEFLMEVVAVQKKMLANPVVGEFHVEDENHSWIDFNKKLLFDEGENVVVSVLSLKK